MAINQGSLNLESPSAGGGTPVLTGGAGGILNNGISVLAGVAMLGDVAGTPGNGVLLNSRTIYTGTNRFGIRINSGLYDKSFSTNGTAGQEAFYFRDELQSITPQWVAGATTILHIAAGTVGLPAASAVDTAITAIHESCGTDFTGLTVWNKSAHASARSRVVLQTNAGTLMLIAGSTANSGLATIISTCANGLNLSATSTGSLTFVTNTLERFRINSAGIVLVGFTSDTTAGLIKFQVNGKSYFSDNVNIGIITSDPGGAKLYVNGKTRIVTTAPDNGMYSQPLGRISTGEVVALGDAGDIITGTITSNDAATPQQIINIPMLVNSSICYHVCIVGKNDVTGETKAFEMFLCARRDSGAPYYVGTAPAMFNIREDSAMSTAVGGATGSVNTYAIYVTGIVATTIKWSAVAFGRQVLAAGV